MINLKKYKDLLEKNIVVKCMDNDTVKGEWVDWTSAADNEPDEESITLKTQDGSYIEIYISEIKKIEEVNKK